MPNVSEAIAYLDTVLEPSRFSDYGPNGLQVPCSRELRTVVTGVSAHIELFERAAARGADLVLVHHGLFWRGQPLAICDAMYRRLKLLFDNDIALAAYHLPLDAHPEHGNNALLAAALGATDCAPFAEHDGVAIGVRARFADPLTLEDLVARVRAATDDREPLVIAGGPDRIATIGIVSGAGTDNMHDALALGLDAFLTGEPAERAFGIARDEGIHFLAGGHYATETFGVRRIGELLAARFGIEHEFIDVPNPI